MSIILGNGDALKDLHIGNKKISKVVVGNKVVWQLRKQIINYRLLYHLGNEFTNVAGTDEARYAINTGGWENIRATNSILYEGTQIGYKTSLNINTSGYNYIGAYKYVTNGEYKGSPPTIYNGGAGGFRNGGGVDNPFVTKFLAQNRSGIKGFVVGNLTDVNTNICFSIGTLANRGNFSNAKNENNLYCRMANNTGSYTHTGTTYSVFLYKTDSISGLSVYGSDIATILSNATNLFTDVSALNWMVLNCTGDFMISALSNTTFINAMNSSPNKAILLENEHWNRFMQLLSI